MALDLILTCILVFFTHLPPVVTFSPSLESSCICSWRSLATIFRKMDSYQPVVSLVKGCDLSLLEQDHHFLLTKPTTSPLQCRHLPVQQYSWPSEYISKEFASSKNVWRVVTDDRCTCGEPPPHASVLQQSRFAGRLGREIAGERRSVGSFPRLTRMPETVGSSLLAPCLLDSTCWLWSFRSAEWSFTWRLSIAERRPWISLKISKWYIYIYLKITGATCFEISFHLS